MCQVIPLWAVIVTIAFDNQTLVAPSLNNHIDAVPETNWGVTCVSSSAASQNFALEVFRATILGIPFAGTTSSICDPTVHRRHGLAVTAEPKIAFTL
jgi:hypothetical protein